MPTSVSEKTQIPDAIDARILSRILEEGYGPGAWHGNDMKAAVADVSAEDAFWRPQPERHDIAELALHHTYFVRQVRARLSAKEPEPFVLKGEDWFALPDERVRSCEDIRGLLDTEQRVWRNSSAAYRQRDNAARATRHRSTSCWVSPATRSTTQRKFSC